MTHGSMTCKTILALGTALTAAVIHGGELAVQYRASAGGYEMGPGEKVTKIVNQGTLGAAGDLFLPNQTPTTTVARNAMGSGAAFRFAGDNEFRSASSVSVYPNGHLGMGGVYFVVSRSNLSGSSGIDHAPFAHGTDASRHGYFVGKNGFSPYFYGQLPLNAGGFTNEAYDTDPDLVAVGYCKSQPSDTTYTITAWRKGRVIGSRSGCGAVNSVGVLALGSFCSDITWDRPWNGDIAEVRLYTGGMTPSEYFKVTCELAATYNLSVSDDTHYAFSAAMLNGFKNDPAAMGVLTGVLNAEAPAAGATSGALTAEALDATGAEDRLVYVAHDGAEGALRKWVVARSDGAAESRLRLTFSGAAFTAMTDPVLACRTDSGASSWIASDAPVAGDGTIAFTLEAGWRSGQYRVAERDDLVAADCPIWFRADRGVVTDDAGNVTGWCNSGSLGGAYDVTNALLLEVAGRTSSIQYENAAPSFNGRPAVRFTDGKGCTGDARKQYLTTPDNVPHPFNADGCTIFAVVEMSDSSASESFFGFDDDGEHRFGMQTSVTWTPRYWSCCYYSSGTARVHKRPNDAGSWERRYVLAMSVADLGSFAPGKLSVALSDNGNSQYELAGAVGTNPFAANGCRMTVGTFIGGWGPGIHGRIAEIRYYDRPFTVREIARTELELSARYGLPVATAGATDPALIASHACSLDILGGEYARGKAADPVTGWTDGMLTATIGEVTLGPSASNTISVVAHDGGATAFTQVTASRKAMARTYLVSSQTEMPVSLRFATGAPAGGETYQLAFKANGGTSFVQLPLEGEVEGNDVVFTFPSGIAGGVYQLRKFEPCGTAILLR